MNPTAAFVGFPPARTRTNAPNVQNAFLSAYCLRSGDEARQRDVLDPKLEHPRVTGLLVLVRPKRKLQC